MSVTAYRTSKKLRLALAALFLSVCRADAQTIELKSNESKKISEHVFCGIPFFGLNYMSFDKPDPNNPNNVVGWKKISVWDEGKLVTVSVSDEVWEETRIRTTKGCVAGKRISSAKFTYEITAQPRAGDAVKIIKGTDVKLVSLVTLAD
ncbi:MAG: hypothetical protein K2Y39_21440 [Candidatus Obscuribacterales bacterium]|nr:hypothetical protein [Candidatus Obscuribacterales bacterium]